MKSISQTELSSKIESGQIAELLSFSDSKDLNCSRKVTLGFNRYLRDVFKYDTWKGESHLILESQTNTGKTSAVLKEWLANEEYVIVLCSELLPAMQVAAEYNLPLHWPFGGSKLDPDTKQLVTVYNHLSDFNQKGKPKHVVVLDESHSLVTDLAYREEVISKLMKSLHFYKQVICLTGTHVKSKFFNQYLLIEGKSNTPPVKASLVKYQNDIAAVTKIASHYVLREGKKVMIYLQDTDTKLPRLTQALYKAGITSIALLNSGTIDDLGLSNGQQIIDEERFDTEILITTYRQSYNLKMKDVVFICFPDTDIVSIAQSIVRVREPLYKAFILSNANKEDYDYEETYTAFYNYYEEQANTLLYQIQFEQWNEYQIASFLEEEKNGKLIIFNQFLDHLKIAYKAYVDTNHVMRFDRRLLKTALAKYNVEIIEEFYDKSTKLNLDKSKTDVEVYLQDIVEILDALEFHQPTRGLNRKLLGLVYKLKAVEPDFAKVREYFVTEYRPGCKSFKKKLLEQQLKHVSKSSNIAAFKRILIDSLDKTKTYTIEELKEKVSNASQLSGFKVKKNKEIYVLDTIIHKERTSIMKDGEKLNIYSITHIIE